ncbi:MAG: nucleoside-diphosphate-sugar epimerase, partial [Acidobacteria bacterium]|nr:nucleoside-diphosphate-sugar epimerase [Acidobacteriota bacterium]
NLLAMERSDADYTVLNVGTGRRTTLLELTHGLLRKLRPEGDLQPQIAGSFREGDIRHCFADISQIQKTLGFAPRVSLEEGYDDLAEWARTQRPVDRTEQAFGELRSRGLVR